MKTIPNSGPSVFVNISAKKTLRTYDPKLILHKQSVTQASL